jgi:hypothetical protein
VTRGVDDLLTDLAEAIDAAAELVDLGKERWDAERPLRLAGEAVIGRLGDVPTVLKSWSCGTDLQVRSQFVILVSSADVRLWAVASSQMARDSWLGQCSHQDAVVGNPGEDLTASVSGLC